ncbi:MAG TPA: flagellar biosynthesis protein FliQ [Syntrophales bacterium]|nr:flagellar biosynthesis protein FliQ [Syntrophales bacterium]HOM06898.1 flagellar biosynthesis protein FliQ [Syntrophales bacterium]HON99415.1 flagellar biosynthesis protein FliQ [Syntrophales bacterium]HPC00548.1 flagellar biosynthesis protein FliQ [Syntrophales bacterium]HPQ06439.1 flagellar biosynthesis protein FliQ [Syntrophales bacterium]
MTADLIVGLMAETVKVTLLTAAPILLVGLLVGVFVSLIQAVTQVQEITLVFVPKIVACLVTLVATLPWIIQVMIDFTTRLFQNIPMYVR